MKCAKIEKWISDDLDGALAPRKKPALDRHVASCPACRAYRLNLEKLQAGALGLDRAAERPEAYWRDFGARLAAGLRNDPAPRPAPSRAPLALRRPWAWGGAGLAAAAAVAAYFVFLQPKALPGPFVFSFEDTVASIMEEIGDNSELESSFNLALQASIEEAIREDGESALRQLTDDPLVWEGLTEDEMALLESKIRNEKQS